MNVKAVEEVSKLLAASHYDRLPPLTMIVLIGGGGTFSKQAG
jgi:hypothetical protein